MFPHLQTFQPRISNCNCNCRDWNPHVLSHKVKLKVMPCLCHSLYPGKDTLTDYQSHQVMPRGQIEPIQAATSCEASACYFWEKASVLAAREGNCFRQNAWSRLLHHHPSAEYYSVLLLSESQMQKLKDSNVKRSERLSASSKPYFRSRISQINICFPI